MLHSERMKLVTVLAERAILAQLVHLLHTLGRVHLVSVLDHGDSFLSNAGPHAFFPAEGYLVTLRGIKEYFKLEPPKAPSQVLEAEIVLTLPDRMEILNEEIQSRQERITALTTDMQTITGELRLLEPFLPLDVTLDLLDGYESLEIVSVMSDPAAKIPDFNFPVEEVRSTERRKTTVRLPIVGRAVPPAPRIFVTERANGAQLWKALEEVGAARLELPKGRPHLTPKQESQRLQARGAEINAELEQFRTELAAIAEENRSFIYAAEETLAALVEKNRGSTYLAVSGYALAGRFWVPEGEVREVKERIEKAFPGQIEIVVEGVPYSAERHEEESHAMVAPTRLRNMKQLKPFEMLTEVYDVPSYEEVDPTPMLGFFFPIFFGFIVGDAGYSLLMAVAGVILWKKFAGQSQGTGNLLYCLTLSAVMGFLFGVFVFADAFGIPFHEEEGTVFSWSRVFPHLPEPWLLKGESTGVSEMLMLSIIAGWVHMTLGCAFGMANEMKHSIRHTMAKAGQMLLIFGMAVLVLTLEGFKTVPLGKALWSSVFSPMEAVGLSRFIGGVLLAGLLLTLIGDGLSALLEFFGLFANVVSFIRLALVGVSKGAIAVALNAVVLPELVKGEVSVIAAVGMIIALTAGHIVLILLGVLSASVQSIRLHYYETFSKFFKGRGMKFVPFGSARIYTRA